MCMYIYILGLMISTSDLACVLRKALVSSLSEEGWPKSSIHKCWALSQRKLGLMRGSLTLQLVGIVDIRKEEPPESLVMTFVVDIMYFSLLFSFSVIVINCN